MGSLKTGVLAGILALGAVSSALAGVPEGKAGAGPAGVPAAKLPEKQDAAALEKLISDAPGPINCYTNNTGDVLVDCELREKGISAFRKLYETDKKRAIAAVQKRFDEIPSPKGGYFPILASVQVKDKAFIPALKKLAAAHKEDDLGVWATEAAKIIETGKCSQVPAPPKLRELCL